MQAQALAEEAEAHRQAERTQAEEAEDVAKRVQRRNMWVMAFAVVALLLAVAAGLFYVQAEDRRIEAENQSKMATVRQLAAQSQALIGVAPQRSLLLALEALHLTEQVNEPLAASEQSLRNALANTGGITLNSYRGDISAMSSDNGRSHDLGGGSNQVKSVSKVPLTHANLRCNKLLNPSSLQRIPTPLNLSPKALLCAVLD